MKKFFMTMCAAFAMFAMVACGGGNAAIEAAEAFKAEPTVENAKALTDAVSKLEDNDAKKEFAEWWAKNATEIATAAEKAGAEVATAIADVKVPAVEEEKAEK